MGIVELTKGPVDRGVDAIEKAEVRDKAEVAEIKAKYMPKDMGLPPLLEKKRQKHFIPDFVFEKAQAVYDRVVVYQVPEEETGRYGGGPIEMTDRARYRDEAEAPRAVIISAGLQALDALMSNGIGIGHTIYISRMSTYSIHAGWVLGKEKRVLVVHAGEICTSEDLLRALREGRCRVEIKEIERDGVKQREHFFVDEKREVWNPVHPNFTEDY
jgi:hypothetical protein